MSPQLCLGTVQMGLNYGITNSKGKVSSQEVIKILEFASSNNINFLDTAQAYGSAEYSIGKCSPLNSSFKIISKMPSQSKENWPFNKEIEWEKSLFKSLKNLNVESLDSLLLHQPKDLVHPQGERLRDWLKSLQERELVRRIGVSIYAESDLDRLPLDDLKLVQLPLSLYDQRFLNNGTIDYLISKGISVHIRSIFLQGLILSPWQKWPTFLSSEFIEHHKKLVHKIERNDSNLLDLALGFVHLCRDVEAVVFGVTSIEELNNIYQSWNKIDEYDELIKNIISDGWEWKNIKELDPRNWEAN
tara:strand:+ start:33138 stop:34043 length:906 start_codon:yes stop_codon:yes gene_type:complete